MSYPINQRINPTYQPSMGFNQPQLQDVDAEKIQQGITQNSALKAVASGEETRKWLTPVLTIPAFVAMSLGMDKFNGACKGEYNKSLIGQIGNWAEKVGNNKFFQSKPMKWLENTSGSSKKWFMEKLVPKSKILSAMFHTPSEPTQKMVLMMKNGTIAEVATDAASKLDEHFKKGAKLTLNGKILTADEVEKLSKETHTKEGIDKIIKICEEQGDAFVDAKRVGKIPLSEKITGEAKYLSEQKGMSWVGNVLGRKVHFSEYANKMNAFKSTKSTWLGKGLPKFTLRLVEGLTNGTAGGKIAILMAAYFVADAIKKTIDAPKGHGEKRKTFTENMFYNEAMYLTMPLGIKIMHSMGGLQYIGLNKEKVDKFRTELTAFNEKVNAGGYTDKTAYKAEKQRVKDLLKSDIDFVKGEKFSARTGKFFKNILFKPLKTAARILTVGLENFESFNPKNITSKSSAGEQFEHFFKTGKVMIKGKNRSFKWAAGGPTRFIFYLFLIAPPLGKLGARLSHIIFGKPTKSVLDEGKEEEKAKSEVQQPLQVTQQPRAMRQQNAGFIPPQSVNNPARNLSNEQMAPVQGGNLVTNYRPNAMVEPQPKSSQMMNTSAVKSLTMPNEPVRTYIPSSEGVKVAHDDRKNKVGLDIPQVDVVMNKADRAEQKANKFVGG